MKVMIRISAPQSGSIPAALGAAGGSVVNLGEAMRILELHREGLSISAIAERTGKDRKTVRKYLNTDTDP